MNRLNIKYLTYSLVVIAYLILMSCNNNNNNKQISENDLKKKLKEPLRGVNKMLVEDDKARIEGYCKRRKWNMKVSGTGLYYDIYEKTNNEKVEKGDLVTINYKIKLLDGRLCYSSDSTGPKIFEVGHGNVERGLEEGILLMKENEKANFIMPPYLAHGLIGDEKKIPARSIIVYNVELIKIQKN